MVTTADVETCFNINVRTFGDVGEFGDRCLLLMNHRTHLDWLFLWSVVSRYGNLYCWKAVMKSSLKHIPLYGVCECEYEISYPTLSGGTLVLHGIASCGVPDSTDSIAVHFVCGVADT